MRGGEVVPLGRSGTMAPGVEGLGTTAYTAAHNQAVDSFGHRKTNKYSSVQK